MSPFIRLLASFIALIMAMGIGRFSLTPQLPHLISEGQIDLTGAGLIAAANYLGYLIGALDAIRARRPGQAPGPGAGPPARRTMAVRGADPDFVLGPRLLAASAITLWSRDCQRLGHGDDYVTEPVHSRDG